MVKCIAWNIRAGGGVRAEGIARYLIDSRADVIVLSEFRATPPSLSIAQTLHAHGYPHQRTTANPQYPAVNALLVASRWPVRMIKLGRAPYAPYRWLAVNVAAESPFCVMALHVPNRHTGLKYPFLKAVHETVEHWRGLPAIVMGDTNSGKIEIDEESPAFNRIEHQWIESFERCHWSDAFRLLHAQAREFTWYSPNGRNGFRLDQMFLHPKIASKATGFSHHWVGATAERLEVLSDHAAMEFEFAGS